MNSGNALAGLIRQVHSQDGAEPADGDLLARYTTGDGEAFAALVRRYGGLVLGVTRRQLAGRGADDVFQATFLALARAAGRLETRPTLANWLYTVALRQARKARARDARRESLESTITVRRVAADPLDEITGRELLQVIDEELARLPERFRLPVLLCCVQGLSREEAAARLGWSEGTVKGRLERGRRRLAVRLAGRGLAPAVLLAPLATITVPAELLARTSELAVAPWSKAVPSSVASLAALGPPRSLGLVALLAGCVLAAGLGGWRSPPREESLGSRSRRRRSPLRRNPRRRAASRWTTRSPKEANSGSAPVGSGTGRLSRIYPSPRTANSRLPAAAPTGSATSASTT